MLSAIWRTIRADRRGGRELDGDAVAATVPQGVRLAANGPQTIEPAVLRDDLQKLDHQRRDATGERPVDHGRLLFGRNQDRGQHRVELREAVEQLADHGVEFLDRNGDRRRPAVQGRIEQGLGIDVGDMLNAHVGLDLGRSSGISGSVRGFWHVGRGMKDEG